MFPPDYDRYGRKRPPGAQRRAQGEPSQVLTASQIAKIEAAFEELGKKATHWESQAKQWQATASESQTLAVEWQQRVKELEGALAEAQALADEARKNASRWEEVASQAQGKFGDWEEKAGDYENVAAEAEQRVADLETALRAAEEGHAEETERLARVQADFLESKKRLERRFAIQAEAERRDLLRDLLPVLDNLDRALDHLPDQESEPGSMRQGVELTRQSFLKLLASYGVRPIDSLGESFDPEVHEAIGSVPDPSLPPGTVAGVEQKGYLIGDELLRPARVLVTPL